MYYRHAYHSSKEKQLAVHKYVLFFLSQREYVRVSGILLDLLLIAARRLSKNSRSSFLTDLLSLHIDTVCTAYLYK